ncbi:MAG: zinc ribbon domain-containing protein [Candidatus Methanoperedens sp.]|nr:zinc ribbon domain-containing protein [Candidatus Methanoperedens sp.]
MKRQVRRFEKYRDVMNEVLKGSGVAIYSGGKKEIVIKRIHESFDYIESHAQDTPYFMALADGKLMGSKCSRCGRAYATPHAYCSECGTGTDWFDLPEGGKIHCHSVSKYGGGRFLKQAPFSLILVKFENVDSYLMAEYIPEEILELKRMKKEKEKTGADSASDAEYNKKIWEVYYKIKNGTRVKPKFRRDPHFDVRDVYFVPVE